MTTAKRVQRQDIYERITGTVIRAMEEGTVPWDRPWTEIGGPRNLATRKTYRGVNIWMLELAQSAAGYPDGLWCTFRQAKAMGGTVRKGEHGTPVIFWKSGSWRPKPAPGAPEEDEERRYLLARSYTVFNVAQCDGLQERVAALREKDGQREFHPLDLAESLISGWTDCPEIVHGGSGAFYAPRWDRITMPPREAFTEAAGDLGGGEDAYYSTLFHEAVHATGHERRLKRFDLTEPSIFGSESYSKEELTAELGASLLRGLCRIEGNTLVERSGAYLRSWLRRLKEDKKLIVNAAARAQRAADWIVDHRKDEWAGAIPAPVTNDEEEAGDDE